MAAAGEHQTGEEQAAPLVAELNVSTPDATGASMLTWSVADPDGRLLGVEVGIDTTGPGRRLGKDVRQLAFTVQRGDHLACVRPVFAGADLEPVVRCLSFAADNAPPAPNVRVSVRAGDPTATARRGMPVVVEVENQGTTDAPGFAVDVVVSRDGRLEGGLGEVRTVWIDGVKAGGRTSRTTDVTAPRDGQFFVVARADGAAHAARVQRRGQPGPPAHPGAARGQQPIAGGGHGRHRSGRRRRGDDGGPAAAPAGQRRRSRGRRSDRAG